MTSQELEEFARRAEEIYEARLRATLEKTHHGMFVAIEPCSGDYFLGQTSYEAFQAAHAAYPDRPAHLKRIGYRAAAWIGSSSE
jgi:hypothetical protein